MGFNVSNLSKPLKSYLLHKFSLFEKLFLSNKECGRTASICLHYHFTIVKHIVSLIWKTDKEIKFTVFSHFQKKLSKTKQQKQLNPTFSMEVER